MADQHLHQIPARFSPATLADITVRIGDFAIACGATSDDFARYIYASEAVQLVEDYFATRLLGGEHYPTASEVLLIASAIAAKIECWLKNEARDTAVG